MANFTIASFNVNSIRSRLHIVVPWLLENRPQVLCMQETKVEDDKFPVRDFEDAGYHVVYRGKKSYNGVAIASLEEPQDVLCGLEYDGPEDEDRLLRCNIAGIHVINAYVPQGRAKDHPQFEYKLQWMERLLDLLEKNYFPTLPLICCGDLNVAREAIDVHTPKRLLGHVDFNPEVWEKFDRIREWGLIDIFRQHHPQEADQYTFYDYRVREAVERGLGWRIDHVLATACLSEKSLSCSIDIDVRRMEKPSDHVPLIAEFKL